jgi:hypothetical protein
MPRKVKAVDITDSTTYGDITEAVLDTEEAAKEEIDEVKLEEASVPEPPKPKARAKRVAKPKPVLEKTETVVEGDEVAEAPETVEPKPKPKRAANVKVIDVPPVVEQAVEKPKAVRKPRVKKEPPTEQPTQGLQCVVPPFPPRLSRTSAREALYHSLASSGLS